MRRVWRGLTSQPITAVSVLCLVVFVLAAVFAPFLTDFDPNQLNVRNAYTAPNSEHLLGTDDLGRDLYARIIYGGRVSLMIAFASALGSGIVGLLVGLLAGYVRRFDTPLMLFMDGLMAFPGIMLALAVVAVLGPNQLNVFIALVMVYTPRIARVVRSSVLVLREMDYVLAARALGVPTWRIMLRHLLPNALAPWMVQVTLVLAFALLTEAGLSFLGLAGSSDRPSWGGIISEGRLVLSKAPWLALFPGLAIAITVLSINLVGDTLRDTLDSRLKGT